MKRIVVLTGAGVSKESGKYTHYRHPATIGMKMLFDKLMAEEYEHKVV